MRVQHGVLAVLLIVGAASTATAEVQIRYRVTFDATWSAETHPGAYPGGAHFSPLIGVVHDEEAVFWEIGGLATPGIESMAETGGTSTLSAEYQAQAALGNASTEVIFAGGTSSPGVRSKVFFASSWFPKLTLVTMIAPSPDWFAGVSGLDLQVDGRWQDGLVVPLVPYDSGTDSGATFNSLNQDTNPQEPITAITTPPLGSGGSAQPVGAFTFTILDVDGLPPYEDADGDGLTNLEEAELGTDLLLPDTDDDTVGDAVDNCPVLANPSQDDTEADGVGDLCDNCPDEANATQSDVDDDLQGDVCDLDDGLLLFEGLAGDSVSWQDEPGYATFNLYRGDLAVLSTSGQYTQDPAAPEAERFCGLVTASLTDDYTPSPEESVFYLVTGVSDSNETSLGQDSEQGERPNHHPCL